MGKEEEVAAFLASLMDSVAESIQTAGENGVPNKGTHCQSV
jgi:hypothetical protein